MLMLMHTTAIVVKKACATAQVKRAHALPVNTTWLLNFINFEGHQAPVMLNNINH